MSAAHKSCGKQSGYVRHAKLKGPACQPCLDAHAAYNRERYRVVYGPARNSAAPGANCGTYNGYMAHRRRREDACEECQAARREYQRAWRAARKQAAAVTS